MGKINSGDGDVHEGEKRTIKTESKVEIMEEQGVKQREGRERLVERARLTYVRIRERRQIELETDSHGEKFHGKDGVKDAHTHAHTHKQVARDNGGELAERVGTWCEQLGVLPREQGEGVFPLRPAAAR